MGRMLYNGAVLPDIEALWTNKESYPYAFISCRHDVDGAYWLYIVTDAPDTDYLDNYGQQTYNRYYRYYYDVKTAAWKGGYYYNGNGTDKVYRVIWSSTDVYNYDKSLHLAASAPVDPNIRTTSATSAMLSGWLMGKEMAGVLYPRDKQWVANLYNGVRLPLLPAEPKFSNLVIKRNHPDIHSTRGEYAIWCFSYTPQIESNGTLSSPAGDKAYCYFVEDGQWVLSHYIYIDPDSGVSLTSLEDLIWSNRDIVNYNTDGSVCLAATEPVAVWEWRT